MNKFTNRIHQLNKLINEVAHPDDVEVDLVIENDEIEEGGGTRRRKRMDMDRGKSRQVDVGDDQLSVPYDKHGSIFANRAIDPPTIKTTYRRPGFMVGTEYEDEPTVYDRTKRGDFKKLGENENDEQLDEKAPPRRRTWSSGKGPRVNTVYGSEDRLASRQPSPTKIDKNDHGYKFRSQNHVATLKHQIKNRNNDNTGQYEKPFDIDSDSEDYTGYTNKPGGFKKLGKK